MNPKYKAYKGSEFCPRIFSGDKKVYYVYKGKRLVWRDKKYSKGETVFESSVGGTYTLNLPDYGTYDVILVGGGGAAWMQGVYDDRGYLATGGSGAAYVGRLRINAGTYTISVGKTVNNTTPQIYNTQNCPPPDSTVYNSEISGVITVGGGKTASSRSSAGAGGTAPILYVEAISTTLSVGGNSGASGSGGKGSGANYTHNGGASVYEGYGKGQGGSTSEYAGRRYWINGTDGYVKIVYVEDNPE